MTPVVGGSPLVVDSLGIAVAELPLQQLLLGAMILLSIGTLLLVSRSTARLTDPLTDRFIGGVPWGTLVVVSLLLAVYYGVQGGLDDPNDPVVLPFRAWSYFDPVGMLMAGFSHANFSHLTGNVIGTLAFGSVAEYWWGHYVDRRTETSWERLWTDPRVRAVLIFPVATILVGIGGTLVSIGPIIGFSTVVFAFAGFGLVRYPIQTVIASVGQGVLGRLFDALRMPQQVAAAEASYSTPWFANIAIQGHLVGLLLGVLLGLAVLRLRNESPPPALHVWTGLLLFAVSRALWAVYWFRGNETYVLYRALGLALVFALVAILTVSIVAPNRPLVPNWAVPDPKTVTESVGSTTGREVGLLLVLSVTAAVVGPAVPVNLTIADDAALPGEPIEIEGYEITYAENVPNGQLSVIPAAIGGETTQLNTSGVIVRNTDATSGRPTPRRANLPPRASRPSGSAGLAGPRPFGSTEPAGRPSAAKRPIRSHSVTTTRAGRSLPRDRPLPSRSSLATGSRSTPPSRRFWWLSSQSRPLGTRQTPTRHRTRLVRANPPTTATPATQSSSTCPTSRQRSTVPPSLRQMNR